jgi:hypothetical protein
MRMIRIAAIAATIAVSSAGTLAAQGNISTQGYGYPPGQLSARALSMGGSIGEIDQGSALNPASIGRLTTRTILFQIEPEYRLVKSPRGSDHTTTARYPMVNIGVPFGEHWVFGVSASSLLDRTYQTSRADTVSISGDKVPTTTEETSQGAMNDLRMAATWTNRRWLYIGAGVSGVTGRNVLTTLEQFGDSAFNAFTSDRVLSYSGSALSAGVQLYAATIKTVFGFDARLGNSLKMRANDTTLATGKVPGRFGASVAYTGLQGTVVSFRVAQDQWSKMSPMLLNAGSGEKAHDSFEMGVGAEVSGPSVLGQTLLLRGGGRSRTLPFEAAGKTVTEKVASFGTGANFGGGRMSTDLTILRQWRSADIPSVSERAWTLSLSLTARP